MRLQEIQQYVEPELGEEAIVTGAALKTVQEQLKHPILAYSATLTQYTKFNSTTTTQKYGTQETNSDSQPEPTSKK